MTGALRSSLNKNSSVDRVNVSRDDIKPKQNFWGKIVNIPRNTSYSFVGQIAKVTLAILTVKRLIQPVEGKGLHIQVDPWIGQSDNSIDMFGHYNNNSIDICHGYMEEGIREKAISCFREILTDEKRNDREALLSLQKMHIEDPISDIQSLEKNYYITKMAGLKKKYAQLSLKIPLLEFSIMHSLFDLRSIGEHIPQERLNSQELQKISNATWIDLARDNEELALGRYDELISHRRSEYEQIDRKKKGVPAWSLFSPFFFSAGSFYERGHNYAKAIECYTRRAVVGCKSSMDKLNKLNKYVGVEDLKTIRGAYIEIHGLHSVEYLEDQAKKYQNFASWQKAAKAYCREKTMAKCIECFRSSAIRGDANAMNFLRVINSTNFVSDLDQIANEQEKNQREDYLDEMVRLAIEGDSEAMHMLEGRTMPPSLPIDKIRATFLINAIKPFVAKAKLTDAASDWRDASDKAWQLGLYDEALIYYRWFHKKNANT